MPKFLVWSDLHDEAWNGFGLPDLTEPVDTIMIAGDTNIGGVISTFPLRLLASMVALWFSFTAITNFSVLIGMICWQGAGRLTTRRAEGLDVRVLQGGRSRLRVSVSPAQLWTNL